LEELLYTLDAKFMERDLCRAIDSVKNVILEHMAITEKLTNEYKGNQKSYLEVDNGKCSKT